MTKTAWTDALERMLARIDVSMNEPNMTGFPHFADPQTGRWTRSSNGDWTGGFWNGLLWLAAQVTGDQRYHAEALAWAQRLRSRATSDTVFRGFLFWYGAALGTVLFDDPLARAIALEGAQGLAQLYNPRAGVIPLGTEAEEASHVGRNETNIDGVPGGTPLLYWAAQHGGDPSWQTWALTHAGRHCEFCVRPDNSVCQSASFDADSGVLIQRYTHKGVHDNSTWGRAQAWAMLGFTQAAHLEQEKFTDIAVRVSDWWIDHLPADNVAFWDFDDPAIPQAPLDTSATAIAAASLLKLAPLVPTQAQRYRQVAEEMVMALITQHLTPLSADDQRQPGILIDGCYNYRIGLATSNELIWGDYYLFEALLVLSGHLDSSRI